MLAFALITSMARGSPAAPPVAVEAPPVAVEAPPLLAPLPAHTTLERVETHAEYVRYFLRADRPFVVELTPERGGAPVCAGGGAALWVRMDLAGDAESFVWDPLPTVVTRACERLPTHPPTFAPPVAEAPPASAAGAPWGEPPAWRWRPLHAIVVPLLALLAWLLPRDPIALGAGLLALLARLALTRPAVLLGGDAAYERLLRARGLWDPDAYYGEAWPAFMGLVRRALGSPDHFVHAVNIGLSALTVPYVVALARRAGAGTSGALAAGVILALHPLAVAVAGMEDVFVLVGLLQVVAVVTALPSGALPSGATALTPDSRDPAPGRSALEPWAAAFATGLLVHLRPEQAAFALVPLALLARRRAWAPLAIALWLCAARWAELAGAAPNLAHGADILAWRRWIDPSFLFDLLLPAPGHAAILLDPTRSPAAVAVLVAIGVATPFRRTPDAVEQHAPYARERLAPDARERHAPDAVGAATLLRDAPTRKHHLAIVLALVIPLALVLPKTSPLADPVRFQLPAIGFAAVLAGVGIARFRDHPRALAGWAAALALTTVFARAPLDGGWAWAHEYTHLRAHIADMPAGTLVLYRPDQDPHHHFGEWVDGVSLGDWRPMGSVPAAEGAWYWRGFADAAAGTWPPMPCDLEPLAVTAVSARTDGWIVLPNPTLDVGFYRVGRCGGAVTTATP